MNLKKNYLLISILMIATAFLSLGASSTQVKSMAVKSWVELHPTPVNGGIPRLNSQCIGNAHLTLTDLPRSWQSPASLTAITWSNAGSRVQITTGTPVTDAKRSIQPLDFDGKPIDGFLLGECEVRVIPASSLPKSALMSIDNAIIEIDKKGFAVLAGLSMSYKDDSDTSVAALIVMNDITVKWATSFTPLALDVQTIVLHELGHALGVKHLSNSDAVMSGNVNDHISQWLGIGKVDLTKSDKEAIKVLYPVSK